MKTKAKFAEQAKNYQTSLRRRAFEAKSGLIAGILIMLGLSVAEHLFWPRSHAVENAAPLIIFCCVLFLLLRQSDGGRKRAKLTGFVCPACQEAFSISDSKLVLATRNCPYCGQEILAP